MWLLEAKATIVEITLVLLAVVRFENDVENGAENLAKPTIGFFTFTGQSIVSGKAEKCRRGFVLGMKDSASVSRRASE